MSADIIDLDKLRERQQHTPGEAEEVLLPQGFFSDDERRKFHETMRGRFYQCRDLAEAGDTSVIEKMAEYAMALAEEARSIVCELGCARRHATGEGREKYATPDAKRPWDVAGFDGLTVTMNVERALDNVRLQMLGNDPKNALHAVHLAERILKNALIRQQELQKRADRREREEHKATRDREELERERKRIERQLAAMDKPAAG
jgi:hypothetical protein